MVESSQQHMITNTSAAVDVPTPSRKYGNGRRSRPGSTAKGIVRMRFSVRVHRYDDGWMISVPMFGATTHLTPGQTIDAAAHGLISQIGSAPRHFEVDLVPGPGLPGHYSPEELEQLYRSDAQRIEKQLPPLDLPPESAVAERTPGPSESGDAYTTTELDTSKPHPARVYDWYLGGKDNFAADREAGRAGELIFPTARLMCQVNRSFMHRATRYAATSGIRQFVDIGTGIPTEPNLHQIAQQVRPDARVVYTDNDPLVLTHARALMTSTPEGRTEYLQSDLRDPAGIVAALRDSTTVDLDEPVALSLIALLHFFTDDMGAYQIVETLTSALAPGSLLTMTHLTADHTPQAVADYAESYTSRGILLLPRTHQEFRRFFDGLELLDPGVTGPHRWHPDTEPTADMDSQVSLWAGIGKKPSP